MNAEPLQKDIVIKLNDKFEVPWDIEEVHENNFNVALNGKALSFIFKHKE